MINSAKKRVRGVSLVIGGLGVAAALVPGGPAQACGGFFCNQPQNPFDPPPVAQTAENVLFAMEKDAAGVTHLEAHVQIFYQGPADRFSWVVPVDNKPELDVGTNRLFSVLDPMTTPRFGVQWQDEGTCKVVPRPSMGFGGSGGAAGPPRSVQDAASAGAFDAGAPVEVAFRGDVGPYDAAVIRSTNVNDPKPLKDWLELNMYYLSPEGGKLIDDYVREGKWFVAIRLINGKTVQEIQPLVMRFDGPSPCIPLRLTSIASINDLRVNLWVLANERIVPENYFEILINPARIDWFSGGSNYDGLVKEAANQAGGNAFVTEYAGSAGMLRGQIYNGRYDITRIAMSRTPPEAMSQITIQGFPRDAALLEILRKHIPQPEALKARGISELQFYNQLALYWSTDMRLFAPFDAAMMASDINARLVQPLVKAQALFNRFAKLTRLSTFISPDEMNVDPLFMTNSTLPDVPVQRTSRAFAMCGNQQYTRCEAPVRLELPDGQKVFFKPRKSSDPYCTGYDPFNLDRGKLDQMAALETAYARESIGEGAARINNRPAINADLEAHNIAARAAMAVGDGKSGPNPVGPGTGTGSGAGGMTGEIGPDGMPIPRKSSGGWGCAIGGFGGGEALTVLALAVGWAMRRRRL